MLVCRLAWNHPLTDGNKRAAWAALVLFIDLNGGRWHPDPPDVDDAERTMIATAAGEIDEASGVKAASRLGGPATTCGRCEGAWAFALVQ